METTSACWSNNYTFLVHIATRATHVQPEMYGCPDQRANNTQAIHTEQAIYCVEAYCWQAAFEACSSHSSWAVKKYYRQGMDFSGAWDFTQEHNSDRYENAGRLPMLHGVLVVMVMAHFKSFDSSRSMSNRSPHFLSISEMLENKLTKRLLLKYQYLKVCLWTPHWYICVILISGTFKSQQKSIPVVVIAE